MSQGPVYVDTTLVHAATSMDTLKEREEITKPPLSIHEYLHRLYTENPAPNLENEVPPSPSSSPDPSTPDNRIPPRYRKPKPNGRRGKANNELVSRTDPDTTLVSRHGFDMRLAYKAHIAVSGVNGQVITATIATTGARSDEHNTTSKGSSRRCQIWYNSQL